jgi:hypothetical protein
VNAGTAGQTVAVATLTAVAPTWPNPPVEPWYVVQAVGDPDGDGVQTLFVGSSFTGELYTEDKLATGGRLRASDAGALALAVLAAAGIGAVRERLADAVASVKASSDIYALPAPDQLELASLGYRAAAADLIWAYVLVSQGIHTSERRRFDHGVRYFESIFMLDPSFREPYLMVDAILTFGAVRATEQDARDTRRLLELGVEARPFDAQLVYQAGAFIAYIAPTYLPEAEHVEWQLAGARLIARAAELGNKEAGTRESLAGASLLSRNGQRDAAVAVLERTYELTDDEGARAEILRRLAGLRADAAIERAKNASRQFEAAWHQDLPFVSRSRILLLGPKNDLYACTGPRAAATVGCTRDWKTWIERTSAK